MHFVILMLLAWFAGSVLFVAGLLIVAEFNRITLLVSILFGGSLVAMITVAKHGTALAAIEGWCYGAIGPVALVGFAAFVMLLSRDEELPTAIEPPPQNVIYFEQRKQHREQRRIEREQRIRAAFERTSSMPDR